MHAPGKIGREKLLRCFSQDLIEGFSEKPLIVPTQGDGTIVLILEE